MGAEYAYDEDGYLWPFFVFTLTLIVTIPLTFLVIKRSRDPAAAFPRVRTDFRHAHWDAVEALRRREKRKDRKLWLTLVVLGGWLVVAYMLYLIQTTEVPSQQLWNPYDILGISESASEKAIKSTYRKLSLKFHPDKVKPDADKNETIESLNDQYVEISKAYQALTDEDVRNNYIQYGNPDGKQGYSINIALPKALVSDGNGKYIVLLYSLVFGVLLPYTVGSWWYGNLRRSKEGVLMESANRLFRKFDDMLDEGGVVAALSVGKEFEHLFAGATADSGLATIESRLAEVSSLMSPQDRERLEQVENGPQRKALALLWAYLGRVELGDPALEKAKFEVAPVALALNKSFSAILLAYMATKPLLASYRASQLLLQAMSPKASPLLQLPYFTPEVVAAIEGDARVHTTMQAFMDQSDARRRKLAVGGNGLLTEEQYREAVRVAKQIPYLRVAKAFFKVVGEPIVTPGSQVTLVLKGRFIPPGSENVPDVVEADLEDVDPAEDDLEAILGKKKKKATAATTTAGKKGAEGKIEEKKETEEDDGEMPLVPPLAAAPYFGRDHSPRWHVFLSDSKQGRVAVPPFTFAQYDRRPFVADAATGDSRPTFAMQTLRAQFVAPPQPGDYTFVMHIVCDSYVGLDTKMQVVLQVKDPSEATQAPVVEDEISEPDEDSIAGIMTAAKGGAIKTTYARRKADVSSSDEESGTEEEAEDTSDTNTDTEPEN